MTTDMVATGAVATDMVATGAVAASAVATGAMATPRGVATRRYRD
ncbi:hypothetical protein ACO0M4_21580 [Streptomyces sp. RGM 3693]